MSERDPGPLGRLASAPRMRLTVGATVVLVVLALAVAVVMSAVTAAGSAPRPVSPSPSATGVTVQPGGGGAPQAPVLVHVLGEVRSPGIYELSGDARVLDAVAAAGGLTDAADTAAVNLARRVMDGEQLLIPKIGEPPPPASGAGAAGGGSPTAAGAVVSLSTATVEQLDALPRIGPAIAQRIIDWRESGGRFTSVDDLLQVDGIGVKTVENLRDLVVP
jgi:competence protein ComEA